MRRLPYARVKSLVKPAYRVAAHHNGSDPGCLWETPTLLVGIRRVARFVAATWARLYKELRLRGTGDMTRSIVFGRRDSMKLPKLLAGLAIAGMALAACGTSNSTGTANKGTIKIGVDFPESGAETSNGIPSLNGVKFAVQQLGSVDGFTLEVFNLDDAVNGVHDPKN